MLARHFEVKCYALHYRTSWGRKRDPERTYMVIQHTHTHIVNLQYHREFDEFDNQIFDKIDVVGSISGSILMTIPYRESQMLASIARELRIHRNIPAHQQVQWVDVAGEPIPNTSSQIQAGSYLNDRRKRRRQND